MTAAIVRAAPLVANPALPVQAYLIVSVLLFGIGVAAVLVRRNAIAVLMGVELMLNAANINFVAFWRYGGAQRMEGLVFAVIVITLAAAEAAIALAIILSVYRRFRTVNVDQVDLMKG
jgi:NADH-quinone oxidoreductase subunit K